MNPSDDKWQTSYTTQRQVTTQTLCVIIINIIAMKYNGIFSFNLLTSCDTRACLFEQDNDVLITGIEKKRLDFGSLCLQCAVMNSPTSLKATR